MKRLISLIMFSIVAGFFLVPQGVEAFSVRPNYVDIQASETERVFSIYVENVQDVPYLVSTKVVSSTGTLTEEQVAQVFDLPEDRVTLESGQILQIPLKFKSVEGFSGNHELSLEIVANPVVEGDQVGFISVFDIPVTIGFGPAVDGFSGLTSANIQREGLNDVRVTARVENVAKRSLTGFYAVQIEAGGYEKTLGGDNIVLRGATQREIQQKYSLFTVWEQISSPKFGKMRIKVSYLPTYGADYQIITSEIYYIPWFFIGLVILIALFGIMSFIKLKNAKKT